MDHPLDLAHSPTPRADFAPHDGFDVFLEEQDIERPAPYQEIAERRAQLESAEILRRGRAL